ncbi:MAG: cellulase family glycosylhydrolase [Acidobacteriota bacterium]|nr:cellulase family glycosylhydrolase [Acidobacteriota bacterium]
MHSRLLSLAVLLFLALPAAAQAQDRAAGLQTAFARAQHLRHGINASQWFAQSRDYSAARTDRYTDAQDIALMAKLGFDNVRLSIDPVPLEQFPRDKDGLNADFVGRLDRAVDTMLADGLAVQIDIHPEDNYKQQLRTSNDAVDRLTMLWHRLAVHYANRDPDKVFYEILNEPEVKDSYRWAGIQARIAAAIREVAPRNTIIATGPNYSDIKDLLTLHPLSDGNVIYNFHFYDPHEFTHQGASWGRPWWIYTHGIPYPPPDSSMQELLKEVPDAADRYQLESYWMDHWDAHRIRMMIDAAAAWGRDNHVPLICNEFGAYREFSEPASRFAYLHDVRSALEADGIGWTMWDYRGGFGVVFKQEGQPARVDPGVVQALGLRER